MVKACTSEDHQQESNDNAVVEKQEAVVEVTAVAEVEEVDAADSAQEWSDDDVAVDDVTVEAVFKSFLAQSRVEGDEEVKEEDSVQECSDDEAVDDEAVDDEAVEAAFNQVKEAAASKQGGPVTPQMKASQLLPMVVMMGLQKVNIEELGYVSHAEAAFVLAQVICLVLLYVVFKRVNEMEDDGEKIRIPEVTQLGQVVEPEKHLTSKEYDVAKWKEQFKQAVLGAVISGGVYYKWQSPTLLVLQVLMTPLQLYESPLFQMHVLGRPQDRPFPTPNPFGMPSAPEPEPPVVADGASPLEQKKVK